MVNMAEFGFGFISLALIFSVYSFVQGLLASFAPLQSLSRFSHQTSGKRSLYLVSFFIGLASIILWNGLLTHDFSVTYIFRNSSLDMPKLYLLTSFWSSLEGSHLLWTALLSIMASLCLMTVNKDNEPLIPGLVTILAGTMIFMTLLCVWASAPFDRLFPPGRQGQGMNPLLQNPYMAIHPPMLFSGYCSLVVPFAYTLSLLLYGKWTESWIQVVRRWALVAWSLLTVGIFLGGKWAYVELGWAGYWAWDPVENSSFMPWLALTCSLHSLQVLDRMGRLPRLTFFLLMMPFSLTFLGTFITRSNIISSVHSFAESSIGPIYLTYVLFLFSVSLITLAIRTPRFQFPITAPMKLLSREMVLLLTQFFLLFLLGLVFIGTLLPLIVEAIRGVKISIQQPFFNAFMPWIGVSLIILMGLGSLLPWMGSAPHFKKDISIALIVSLILSMLVTYFKKATFIQWLGFEGILLSGSLLTIDFINKMKLWKNYLKHNRRYIGSFFIHMGFLCAVWGFLGNYGGIDQEFKLLPQETFEFFGYHFTYEGLQYQEGSNVKMVGAKIKGQNDSGDFLVEPYRAKYTNREEWFHEAGVYSTFWHDIYGVLGSFDLKTEEVFLKIHINPLVKFVWVSLFLMLLGGLICFTHNLKWLLVLVLSITTFPGHSQDLIQDIGKELRCPTCQGVSILESETPQSIAMRHEVEEQIAKGKNKEEVIQYFLNRYGEWILRKPSFSSPVGIFFWVIPTLILILGPGVLLWLHRDRKRKEKFLRDSILEYTAKNKEKLLKL